MPIPYDNEEATIIQTAGTAWAVTATHNCLSQSITGSRHLCITNTFYFGCGIFVNKNGMAESGRGISLPFTSTCGSMPERNPFWFLKFPK